MIGRLVGKVLSTLRQLGGVGVPFGRAVLAWWQARLQDVAVSVIGLGHAVSALGYFILWLIGGGPPPPSAPPGMSA
jgi:hypothetical protein